VLTLDKRRHDPHAPHRYGAGVVYDLAQTRKVAQVHADQTAGDPELAPSITIDTTGNN